MPAPTSAISGADSRTVTLCPANRMAMAAPRPPRPAPTIITWFEGQLGLWLAVGSGMNFLVMGYVKSGCTSI